MIYPIVVSTMLLNHIWYGYAVIIPGILFVVITLMLLKSRFPSQMVDAGIAKELPQMNSKPLVWLEGVASVMFGVAAFSTFYVIVVWMPKYAMAFAGMAEADALKTISYYSMGSLVCVFILLYCSRKWFDPFGRMCLTPGWQPSPQRLSIYIHPHWCVTPVHFLSGFLPQAVFYSSAFR